jgi:deoxycytidine triphosphate deaminase
LLKSELAKVAPGEIGLTVFHPGNIEVLNVYRRSSGNEIVTVGLDTVSSHGEMMSRIGCDPSRDEGEAAFEAQRAIVQGCDAVLQGDIGKVSAAVVAILGMLRSRGVLDGQTMKTLFDAGMLLTCASAINVQPASYDLRVGDILWCKGNLSKLQPNVPFSIPPYSYVVVQAREEARLPNFVAAHYDLKVSLFMQGVILSNGPQVDPGYKGGLLCMLFNGSDSNVGLKAGEHFATIEFLLTSKVTEGYKEHHQNQQTVDEFMHSTTAVSPGGTIFDKLVDLRKSWETFRNAFIVAGVALVVTVLSLALGLVGLLRWGYDTWEKADKATAQSVATVKTLESLLEEERRLKAALQGVPATSAIMRVNSPSPTSPNGILNPSTGEPSSGLPQKPTQSSSRDPNR